MELAARVACRGFSGETAFSISRRDVARFVADLAALRRAESATAQLLGGWDDSEERLRLRVTPAGRSGQFLTRVRIATTGPRSDLWHRVETEFVVPPGALETFLAGVERLGGAGDSGEASLQGDGEIVA